MKTPNEIADEVGREISAIAWASTEFMSPRRFREKCSELILSALESYAKEKVEERDIAKTIRERGKS